MFGRWTNIFQRILFLASFSLFTAYISRVLPTILGFAVAEFQTFYFEAAVHLTDALRSFWFTAGSCCVQLSDYIRFSGRTRLSVLTVPTTRFTFNMNVSRIPDLYKRVRRHHLLLCNVCMHRFQGSIHFPSRVSFRLSVHQLSNV